MAQSEDEETTHSGDIISPMTLCCQRTVRRAWNLWKPWIPHDVTLQCGCSSLADQYLESFTLWGQ